jgi:hypothetical protein
MLAKQFMMWGLKNAPKILGDAMKFVRGIPGAIGAIPGVGSSFDFAKSWAGMKWNNLKSRFGFGSNDENINDPTGNGGNPTGGSGSPPTGDGGNPTGDGNGGNPTGGSGSPPTGDGNNGNDGGGKGGGNNDGGGNKNPSNNDEGGNSNNSGSTETPKTGEEPSVPEGSNSGELTQEMENEAKKMVDWVEKMRNKYGGEGSPNGSTENVAENLAKDAEKAAPKLFEDIVADTATTVGTILATPDTTAPADLDQLRPSSQ